MTISALVCFGFAAIAFMTQYLSCGLALLRCRPGVTVRAPANRPAITLVRPLCGMEHYSAETLLSTFQIDYPDYEILFCVASADDPILPLLRSVIAAHPGHDAQVLIGKDLVGANPKLNNMAKGFREARHAHIVFVDSNVLTPPGYLDRLAATLETGAGMVSAPPVGLLPDGFWAVVECAFLNTYQARMQYAVDTLGRGFAQGKTLFFRREDLEHGGFARLATEPAEDAAATKLMQTKGKRIRLAGPFPQLIGPRSAVQIWKRQVRWARLRRASFPQFFAPEILAGGLPPLLALLIAANQMEWDASAVALGFLVAWYGPELLLARVAGWPRAFPAVLLRDLLLPFVFVAGLAGSSFEWHGQRMDAAKPEEAMEPRPGLLHRLRRRLAD